MYKDPTEFRKRFAKWKETGEYSLPRFADGYEAFFNTLPENQKRGPYPTRRYWELNGKPKDFAEAIGKGMYTILNDNGTLNWHAGSVAYNENTDQYEFMKANYHPARWMELVYGYDQSPEFLKEWKVQYNGPMLSDRYVRREKPGLKIKGGQLPRFAMGTEGYKYVQAGKNNEWSRITDDDMSRAFLDLIVRPKSRGGNTTVGNWNRRWSLKGEPGLEIVSPEFDIISGVRGIQQIFPLKNRIALKVGSVDFDNIAKQVAKMKADNDAWMAIHPEYNIESAINKTKLPNAYETFLFKPIHDVAKEPYYSLNQLLLNPKTSADVAKISPSVRSYAYTGSRTKFNPFGRGYVNLKSFLQSPAYRKRLENYYKQKGSSYVTISHAPDNRIGELLYNIETAKAAIRPRGQLIDENGAIKDSFGLYDPNSHSIQVAVDALERLTPEHEMWHAARRAEPYLDNEKYKMRVKSSSEPAYYVNISELEVRVLDTLREMQESGLDINNLTDDQIWNFLMETPADMHGTNVQSLIDNYWYDDVKRALRNFKGFIPPIATIGIGHGLYNKYAE